MKLFRQYKSTDVFKIALGIAILVIGYIATVFYSKMKKLDDSVELISISNQTQLELENLLSIIGGYETSLRSYIITRDENYLKNRFLNRGEIEQNLKKLRHLTAHNATASHDLDSLREMFDNRFRLFRETLTIAKAGNSTRKDLNAKLLESSDFTDKMRTFVYDRVNAEALKMKDLNDAHQFELEDSIVSAFLLVILSLLILLLSFNQLRKDITSLESANDALKFLNDSFNNAENVAGFGHWKYNLTTQEYSFSDNFYRMMGLDPEDPEKAFKEADGIIHPEDHDHVVGIHQQSLKDMQPTNMVFRYLLKSGDIKYIMAVGSFRRNGKGEMVKVGVNYDVSEQYARTAELEQNNRDLKAINEELESFNNIVSHDLQEPMRKIQMFISRIAEKEADTLSAQGLDYFNKIRLGANRMQNLMIDLVNYTRTIKGDKIFVKVDMGALLTKVVAELAQNIEDKKAKVSIGPLPAIKAIPFQIEQLFINLISNSLKYSKENVAPEISISSAKISDNESVHGTLLTAKKYHKIVLSDDGIGFKQEYAERIFILFQRLATDSKYAGTGIGLAICKRIVENHNGYIMATSRPGEGAAFTIYLPKNA